MLNDNSLMSFLFKPESRVRIYDTWYNLATFNGITIALANKIMEEAFLSGLGYVRDGEIIKEVALDMLASELRLLLIAELVEESES